MISRRILFVLLPFLIPIFLITCAWIFTKQLNQLAKVERLYMGAGLKLRDYAIENDGNYPLPILKRGRIVPDLDYQEFSTKDRAVDDWELFFRDYYYLGYEVRTDDAARDFVALFRNFSSDLTLSADLSRLRTCSNESTEADKNYVRKYVSCSETPVLIERPTNRSKSILVLFLDNHVEEMTYPSEFPATHEFISVLQQVECEFAGE